MPVHRRPRVPPRHLLVVLAAVTVTLVSALLWLGVRLAAQDRELEGQRIREVLERVATEVGTVLHRRLADRQALVGELALLSGPERTATLEHRGKDLGAGAVLVDLTDRRLQAAPGGVLLYDPSVPGPATVSRSEFDRGEWLEFRERDLAEAARVYRVLSLAPAPGLRGGALLRLGRVLRKDGRTAEALEAYARLAELDSVLADGLPSGLVARHGRLSLFEEAGRQAEARAEAESLAARLSTGSWPLSRGTFEFYLDEVGQRIAIPPAGRLELPASLVLSRAVDSLWREPPASGGPRSGWRLLVVDDIPLLVLWSQHASGRTLLVLTPDHLRSWLDASAWQGVRPSLTDAGGRPVLDALPEANQARVIRSTAETGLPWTLQVALEDPAVLIAGFSSRRRTLLFGMAVAVLLVLLGTYAVARGVSRELAVARQQSDFVAAVSHEFRTPLTSLRQVSELLATNRVATEERRAQYHEVLRRESERLHRLVENLLDFGRMEAGARELRRQPLPASAMVREVVEEFRNEVEPGGYRVDLTTDEVGPVDADPEALGSALRNLLDNAVKYSPERGTIAVAVSRRNGRIAVSIRDHGVGIPADEQGVIFEPFVRGRQARASGIRGTGIGLAMVRHIVKAHDGAITVTSAEGQGSTFTILLPPAAGGA